MSMTNAAYDPNPVDDLHASVTGRLRDALYASEAMLRSRAMRPAVDSAALTDRPAATLVDPQAAHLEGHALAARGTPDDPVTPTVDEAVQGDRQSDVYRQMAATHRATFPPPDSGSPGRVPTNQILRPAPAVARRLTARR